VTYIIRKIVDGISTISYTNPENIKKLQEEGYEILDESFNPVSQEEIDNAKPESYTFKIAGVGSSNE